MLVGTSSVDITPYPGVELCGFASREQPSNEVLDRLCASVLAMESGSERLIMINLDLIGIERDFTEILRKKISLKFGIPGEHVQVFATHTHSGPGTIHLNYCGEYNPEYLDSLVAKILNACNEALSKMESCEAGFYETGLQLGVNRRNGDNTALPLKVLALKKPDGDCTAVLVNYPMHPVCLKGTRISADYPGVVKRNLGELLPGNPLVLFGIGAAGDIDPSGVGVGYMQMEKWGSTLVRTAVELIMRIGPACPITIPLRTMEHDIRLGPMCPITIPLRTMEHDEIDKYADKHLSDQNWNDQFGPVFRKAVEKWRGDMKIQVIEGSSDKKVIEIGVLEIGVLKLVFINAEMFSEFEKILERSLESPFIVISCANGLEGYLPAVEDYDRGGYEVETALFFYNSFMPVPGSMERIASEVINS